MKKALLAAIVVTCLTASPALAGRPHFSPPLSKRPLPARASGQRQMIRYDRRAIAATCWAVDFRPVRVALFSRATVPVALRPGRGVVARCRYARAELRWTRRELRETLRKIRVQRSASRGPSLGAGGGWSKTTATWYGPCCYGNGPSCKGYPPLTESSWYVASMTLSCGTMVTLCDRGCARAPVADTGKFAAGNFDLAPAVARAIGGLYTHHGVRWRLG